MPFGLGDIGSLLSGGGGILSAILGAGAANSTNATNQGIASSNLAFSIEQDRLNREFAQRLLELTLADTVNARGDVSGFNEETGQFFTDLSPTGQGLLEGSDAAQLSRLTEGEAIQRRGKRFNETQRADERSVADTFRRELSRPETNSQASIEAALFNRGTAGVNQAFDDTLETALVNSARTGAPTGDIVSKVGKERARAQSTVGNDAFLQSLSTADELQGNRLNRFGNLANVFGSRASNFGDAPFQPSGLEAASTPQNILPQLSSGVIPNAGQQPLQQPNFANALAIGGSFDALGGSLQQIQSGRDFDSLVAALSNRQLGNKSSGASLGTVGG